MAGSRDAPLDNDINENILWGRKYIVIRAIGDTEVRIVYKTHTQLWLTMVRRLRRASRHRRDWSRSFTKLSRTLSPNKWGYIRQ